MTSDGAVSHVAECRSFQPVDVVVAAASSSLTVLHLNLGSECTAAVSGEIRRTRRDTDRASSRRCNSRQHRVPQRWTWDHFSSPDPTQPMDGPSNAAMEWALWTKSRRGPSSAPSPEFQAERNLKVIFPLQ